MNEDDNEGTVRFTEEELRARRNTPEARAARARIAAIRDEDIDFSDIPRITDFSGFIRITDYVNVRDYPTRRAAYDAAIAIRAARRQAAE